MSKLVSSEFQSWESLYWPEGVPRYVDVPLPPPDAFMKGRDGWRYRSGGNSLDWGAISGLISEVGSRLEKRGSRCASLVGDDLLMGLIGESLVMSRTASAELLRGASPSCGLRIVRSPGGTGPGSVSIAEEGADSWKAQADSPVLSVYTGERRAIYSAAALWGDAVSLSTFLGIGSERGIAVMGRPTGEFELSLAAASLAAGIPLTYSPGAPPGDGYSAAFAGSEAIAAASSLPRGLSYAGVEGPLDADSTRKLERSLGYPVLQMYGISGRGILFSNPRDFNVHGSAGISITNVDAVISEVLEASWYRGRRLLGPGEEGELAIKGAFIDMSFNAGDGRQRPIQVRISGKNATWLGVGVLGKMDENGYLYPGGRSFV